MTTPWDPTEATAACASWVEEYSTWKIDGVVIDSFRIGTDGVATITCRTFHLSAFSTSEVLGEIGRLTEFADIPEDLNVLREVRGARVGTRIPSVSYARRRTAESARKRPKGRGYGRLE